MEENNNYFSNLMNTGVEYAQLQIGSNGVIQLTRPYSLSQRPGQQIRPGTQWQENLYNNPNPINPENYSKYDLTAGNTDNWSADDRMNYLQNAQSTAEKIGNSLVNNLVIAGTTAVSSILTIPMGLFTAIGGGNFVENPINRWAVDAQNATQQALPIYRGTDYEDKSLWGKMGTNVFWADLIQNLGFTEGMVASSLALSYLKLPSVAISLISSIGEGSVEAINRKDEVIKQQNEALNQSFNKMLPDAIRSGKTDELYRQYNETKQQIEKDAIQSQNLIFAGNIALLTLTNQIEFGRYLSKGYDTERRFFKNVAKSAEGTYKEISKPQAVLRGLGYGTLNASTEAFEEFSQDILQKWPSMFDDFNHFNSSKFNPEKKELASNLWDAYWDSLVETVNDPQTQVDAMTGFITGLFGMPSKRMTSSGKSKMTWAGGLPGAVQEAYSARANTNEVIRQINQFIQNDDLTKAYYQSLVRDLVLQDEQNLALEQDDKKKYEDAKSARAINEILLYSHIGKIDDLKQKMAEYSNMSDEELQLIVNEIQSQKEDTSYTIDELKDSINKRVAYLSEKIDFIENRKKKLLSKNPLLSDDSLSSILFLESLINDWQKRSDALTDTSFELFQKMMSSYDEMMSATGLSSVSMKNGKYVTDDSRTMRLFEPGEKNVQYYIDEDGKTHKLNTVVVKRNNNGKYNVIKDAHSIEAFGGAVFVVDKSALFKTDTKGEYIYVSPRANKQAFRFWINSSPEYREELKQQIQNEFSGLDINEEDEFIGAIDDLAKINQSLQNFMVQRAEVYQNIEKQNEVEEKKEAEVAKETVSKKTKKAKKEFEGLKTVKELRDKIRKSTLSEDEKQKILDDLEKKGDDAVKRLRQLDRYRNDLIGQLKNMAQNQEYLDNATSLINSGYYQSENLDEFANPVGSWINNTEYFKNKVAGDYSQAYQIASYLVLSAIVNLNEQEAYRAQFTDAYRQMTLKSPFNSDLQIQPASVMYINDEPMKDDKGNLIVSQKTVVPVSHETLSKEIDKQSQQQSTPPDTPKTTVKGQPIRRKGLYYRPAIPLFSKEQIESRDFRQTFAEYMKLEGLGDFTALYDYLNDNGAFEYVNKGNIKPGSRIRFMIDPSMQYEGKPIIFMVHGDDNQVVGSLNNNSTTTEYIGLSELIDEIYKEYNDKLTDETKDQKFISETSTVVSQVMNGNIAYSSEERTLDSSKQNGVRSVTVDEKGNKLNPLIGIMKNMVIATNGAVNNEDIIMPLNASLFNGRIFLLVPTSTGKYFAVPVRAKHFNQSEFNLLPGNEINRESFIGKQLIQQFTRLAQASSYNDVMNVIPDIARDLYIGGIHINLLDSQNRRIDPKSNAEIYQIQIVKEVHDDDGYSLGAGRKEEVQYVKYYSVTLENDDFAPEIKRSEDDILNDLINAFMNLNLLIQIDVNAINQGSYNIDLIESDMLSSNLESGQIVNSWFTINYFDPKQNKFINAVNPEVSEMWKRRLNEPQRNFVDGDQFGLSIAITIKKDNVTYLYDSETFEIRDKQNNLVIDLDEETKQLLRDLDYIYRTFNKANESDIASNGIYKLADKFGFRYLDINLQVYITDKKVILQVEDALKYKQGLLTGMQELQSLIGFNQASIVDVREDGTLIVDNGDVQVPYSSVNEFLPKQYSGKTLTSAQKAALTKFSKGWLAFTPEKYDSIDQMLNAVSHQKGERGGMIQFIRERLEHYGVEMTPELTPNEYNWNDPKFKERVMAALQASMLENIGSGNSAIDIANRRFKQFISDYFNDYFNNTRTLQYSMENNYGMNEAQFNGFKERFDRFVHDITNRGSHVLSANTTLFNSYQDTDINAYYNVDLVIIDKNGSVSLMKILLDTSSWLVTNSKTGKNSHFETSSKNANQVFSDEEQISNELIAAKSLFESQYGIKVSGLTLMPFTVSINKDTGLINKIEIDDPAKIGYGIIANPSPTNKAKLKLSHSVSDPSRITFVEFKDTFPIEGIPQTRVFSQTISQPKVVTSSEQPVEKPVEEHVEKEFKVEEETEEPLPMPEIDTESIDNGGAEEYDDSLNGGFDESMNDFLAGFEDYRIVTEQTEQLPDIDIEHEIDVVTRMLPQLSKENRIKLIDTLIKTRDGKVAMGKLTNDMMTISSLAKSGTVYHEAFHFVFNTLFSPSERLSILNEARHQYEEKNDYSLTEALADDFMEYMQSRNDKGLLPKIKAFFDDLLTVIRSWFEIQPDIKYYFYRISKGKYSQREVQTHQSVPVSQDTRNVSFDKLSQSQQNDLLTHGWTSKMFDSLSNDEKRQALLCIGI